MSLVVNLLELKKLVLVPGPKLAPSAFFSTHELEGVLVVGP